jgi:hypothetical protein
MVACQSDKKSNNVQYNDDAAIQDVIMIGDSLCADKNGTAHLMSIKKDCVSGRTLMSVDSIDYNYRIIYLALGTNDIGQEVSAEDYREKLESIMSDNIICILPNERQDIETQDHRQAMIDTCPSFVDPVYDCAVSIGNNDGVHYIEQDYIALSECLSKKL